MNLDKHTHIGFYGIINKGHRLLIVKKSRGPYKGLFDLPGGKPKYGEPILTTLFREIREETGIKIIEHSLYDNFSFCLRYTDSLKKQKSIYHIALVYKITQFIDEEFNAKIINEDVVGSLWIDKKQLLEEQCSPVLKEILLKDKKIEDSTSMDRDKEYLKNTKSSEEN